MASSTIEVSVDPTGLEELKTVLANFEKAIDRIERAVAELSDDECTCDQCRCSEAIGRC
jgi:hypothetical protein